MFFFYHTVYSITPVVDMICLIQSKTGCGASMSGSCSAHIHQTSILVVDTVYSLLLSLRKVLVQLTPWFVCKPWGRQTCLSATRHLSSHRASVGLIKKIPASYPYRFLLILKRSDGYYLQTERCTAHFSCPS